LQRGFDLPDNEIIEGKYPVVASTSIKAYHNQYKVEPPVITTGRSGSLGAVLFVKQPAWPLNTTLWVKDFYSNAPYFIYLTLKQMKLENFNSGAGIPSLNRNHLSGLKLVVPTNEIQRKFNEFIFRLSEQQDSYTKTNQILKTTRDRLLSRLMSGALDVEELDIAFPPSMEGELAAQPEAAHSD
jgi:type I restriction enzyme S subunit